MIKVGIIGATGYGGVELVRLLTNHPGAKVVAVSSVSFEGQSLSAVYPALYRVFDDILTDEDSVIDKSDVVFASLPHGLSEAIANKCVKRNVKFIDLGADFRLNDEENYKVWYGLNYKTPLLHKKSVYCIPELHRNRVKGAKIIANPGC